MTDAQTPFEPAPVGAREPLQQVECGLPAAWFHDAAHYRRELARFWSGKWIAVARSSELREVGDYRVIDIGDQSIVVLRARSGELRDASTGAVHGQLRAFHNTCRHRGSILCTAAEGRLRGARLVCPYHAWTYDLDGRLIHTPRRMPTPDFDADDYGLFGVDVDSWGGFVFVHLGSGPVQPLVEALGELPARFARHRLDTLAIGKRIVVDIAANWKLICENFCECFHCPPVHPELCRVVPAYREAGAWGLQHESRDEGTGRPMRAGTEYLPGAVTLTLDGTARIPPFRDLDATQRATLYSPALLPPNLFLNVHPDYVNAHMMFPTGPQTVRIVYDWLFEPEALADPRFDLDHYVALWQITNGQDARNCEWQQRGVHAAPFAHGHFMPQEFDCHRFAQWVRAALDSAQVGQRVI